MVAGDGDKKPGEEHGRPWYMFNGGTKHGKIVGIHEFNEKELLELEHNGHNATDQMFILDIEEGKKGYVAPLEKSTNTGG